jgi:hypothetical protein
MLPDRPSGVLEEQRCEAVSTAWNKKRAGRENDQRYRRTALPEEGVMLDGAGAASSNTAKRDGR